MEVIWLTRREWMMMSPTTNRKASTCCQEGFLLHPFEVLYYRAYILLLDYGGNWSARAMGYSCGGLASSEGWMF